MTTIPSKYVALIYLSIMTIFVAIRWNTLDRDITQFIGVASKNVRIDQFDNNIHIRDDDGYDGQYFFIQANHPFGHPSFDNRTKPKSYHVIDGFVFPQNYIYRVSRLMYPMTSWMIAGFGMKYAIPWALVIVNLIMAFLLGYSIARMKNNHDASLLNTVALLLFVGVYQAVARDLSDLMMISFTALSFYGLINKKLGIAIGAACLAVLTKETALVLFAGPLLYYSFKYIREKNKQTLTQLTVWLIPLITLAAVKLFISAGVEQNLSGGRIPLTNFDLPLFGLISTLTNASLDLTLKGLILLLFFSILISILPILRFNIKGFKDHRSLASPLNLSFILFFIVSISLSDKVYEDPWSLGRNLLPLQIINVLWMSENEKEYPLWIIVVLGLTSLPFFYIMISGF